MIEAMRDRLSRWLPEWWVLTGIATIAAMLAASAMTGRPFDVVRAAIGLDHAAVPHGGVVFALFWLSLLGVAWRVVRDPVRLWRTRHRGGHLVISGDESVAAPVVAGQRRAGTPAVVLASGTDTPSWVKREGRAGSPRARAPGRLLHKARMLILARPGDENNVDDAATILGDAAVVASRTMPLPVIVRVDDVSQRDDAEARLSEVRTSEHLHLRFVSLPGMIARALLRSGAVGRVDRAGEPTRVVVIVRWSPVMELYLLDLLVGGHFRDGRPLKVVVLDEQAAACRDALLARWPAVSEVGDPEFCTVDIDAPAQLAAAVESLLEEDDTPVAVVVETTDPAAAARQVAAIDAAFEARRLVPPVYAVHVPTAAVPRVAAPVVAFGGASLAAHDEFLLFERHERLARAVHDFYLEGRLDEGETLGSRAAVNVWERLPEALREDNRLLVELYGLKLRDLGARIMAERGAPIAFDPQEIDDLACAEHARWSAARRLAGWRYGPIRDEAARTSPELTDYAALAHDVAERDREQVRVITRFLARFGQHVRRDMVVAIDGADVAAMLADVESLRASYPERQIVLLGDPTRPAVSAVLGRAGLPVQLVLSAHPADALAQVRALVADADRIHVPARGETVAQAIDRLAERRIGVRDALAA